MKNDLWLVRFALSAAIACTLPLSGCSVKSDKAEDAKPTVEAPETTSSDSGKTVAEKSATVAQLGTGISVDTVKREAYLDATVCLRHGILEYMICNKNTFEHESVFSTEAKPSLIHTALLLISAEPYPYFPIDDWPERVSQHPKAFLNIDVEYEFDGVTYKKRLHEFAHNREREDGVVSDRWTFTGSVFYEHEGKEYYAADSTGGVIGLTPKGASVMQYADYAGIPYLGDDVGLECKPENIPPAGTPVRFIFRPLAAPQLPAAPTPPPDPHDENNEKAQP